jgi:ubiquinone/menaquinone biosynthesis C-methylase UbiE
MGLTDRQKREIEYHRARGKQFEALLTTPFSWDVLDRPSRRWWNAYWQMYAHLITLDLRDKRVLVVGCGYGEDALRLAKLGAQVYAFDLSPESLSLAIRLARREGLNISFLELPAESLTYASDFFDCIVARDILHHVDIPLAMREIRRVAKSGAILVVNEVYSHSFADRIRHSPLAKLLYPVMKGFIYGTDSPYITEDERKLNEGDVEGIKKQYRDVYVNEYFNCLVTRIVAEKFDVLSQIDRLLLIGCKPIAHVLGGRVLLSGRILK